MKVLLTGFEPFNKEKINPSYEAVKLVPNSINNIDIVKYELPTVFSRARKELIELINKENLDVVLCIGQAGNRSMVTVEQVAINLMDASIPDNDGCKPLDEAVVVGGEDGIFATIPVKKIVEAMRAKNIPASVSYSAGTYVCNTVMYTALEMAKTNYPNMKCGFIHVPYIPEQVLDKNSPSMTLDMIVEAIKIAIKEII